MTLEIVTSEALAGIRHGFFTRRGGASSGIFAGLNCGLGSSDQREAVLLNRSRAAEAMGLNADHLVGVYQTHSADVLTVDVPPHDLIKADALVTRTPGIGLAVLTADCQPVLFADPGAGVIGAAHAGWRGALDGILENTIVAMEALGAARANIRAVIGPCISQRSYEVGPEFLDRFLNADPEYARFFGNGTADRYLFDLPSFGLHSLRSAGVADVSWVGHCTLEDEERFFSHRRSVKRGEADYGRLISIIRL